LCTPKPAWGICWENDEDRDEALGGELLSLGELLSFGVRGADMADVGDGGGVVGRGKAMIEGDRKGRRCC